jgi:superfamily I DNA/RNA helicase
MMDYLQMPRLVKDHRLTEIEGGGLTVMEVKPHNQEKKLREVLRDLLEEHDPKDIRVLSPFGGRSSLAGRIVHSEAKSNEAKWLKENLKSPEVPDGIRWRSIMKYKGLESEVVVITDLGQEAEDFFEKIGQPYRDAVYVGVSRAKSKCIALLTLQA